MKLRILGGDGGIARGMRSSAFLADTDLLIDAGTGLGDLTIAEMVGINHIFITHAHMDHIACLPLMMDSIVAERRGPPVTIYGLPGVIDAIRNHIMNDEIWPDFTAIPTPETPVCRYQVIAQNQPITLGNRIVTPLPANHPGECCGFAVTVESGSLAFTGDTGPCPDLWPALAALPNLKTLIIETSFEDEFDWLAEKTGHLTPKLLAEEVRNLQPGVTVYYSHIKPHAKDKVPPEVAVRLGGFDVHPLARGQILSV